MRITYLVEKVGPYHAFRLGGVKNHTLSVIETRPQSERYAWKENISIQTYGLEGKGGKSELENLILNSKPEVLFITGYGFKEMLWAISIGIKNQIPMSLLSDTTYLDEPKNKIKEIIKSFLVAQFDSALVAGTRSRNYLISLKMKAELIFQPYDIIDNEYYAEKSGAFQHKNPYFLCISRLIPAKNLIFLIRSFADYRSQSKDIIDLIILGNGLLETSLMEEIKTLGLENHIYLKGFLINTEVRNHYQNAEALILASTSEPWGLCINEAISAGIPVIASNLAGATEDLIEDSISGFLFSPYDAHQLIQKMGLLRKQTIHERNEMVIQAKKRLESFDLNHFLTGFDLAAKKAYTNFKKKILKDLNSEWVYQISRLAKT